MAFGFIKKVFSFGKKEVEEQPQDTEAAALPPATEAEATAPTPEPADSASGEPTAAPAPDAAPENRSEPEAPAASTAAEETKNEAEPAPGIDEKRVETAPPPAAELDPEVETGRTAEPPSWVEATRRDDESPKHLADEPEDRPERPAPEPEASAEQEHGRPQPAAHPKPLVDDIDRDAAAPVADIQEDQAEPVSLSEPDPGTSPEGPRTQAIEEPVPAPDVPLDEKGAPAATGPEEETGVEPPPISDPSGTQPDASPDEAKGDAEAPAPRHVTVARSVEEKAELTPAAQPVARPSWFQRLRSGLSRSSKELTGNIAGVFTKRKLDEETLQDLEDVLIQADLGLETAMRVTDALASGRYGRDVSDTEVRAVMAEEIEKVLAPVALPLELDLSHKPHVILVVGVNGTGKTTTIGKLAAKLVQGGLSVTLAAGDTFRAAAIEQLRIWGERTGSPVIASKLGADAAGLAYDAFEKAKEAGSDVLIIDTAGRLQNKAELMAELEKIVRVLGKLDPEAPHTVLQTVDATTGQNALNQVEIFRNVAGVNGLVMTKLDGTARGGILVSIAAKHKLPVYFIGIGEQVDDLEPFSAADFAKAIAGVG